MAPSFESPSPIGDAQKSLSQERGHCVAGPAGAVVMNGADGRRARAGVLSRALPHPNVLGGHPEHGREGHPPSHQRPRRRVPRQTKRATSRGIPGAAQSSLDVFALTPEVPDILKSETARLPPKRRIYRVLLISSRLCPRPLVVRGPSTRQLIVNELCDSMVLRNNPPKWWITLLKKLRPAANYEQLLRASDICPKIGQQHK